MKRLHLVRSLRLPVLTEVYKLNAWIDVESELDAFLEFTKKPLDPRMAQRWLEYQTVTGICMNQDKAAKITQQYIKLYQTHQNSDQKPEDQPEAAAMHNTAQVSERAVEGNYSDVLGEALPTGLGDIGSRFHIARDCGPISSHRTSFSRGGTPRKFPDVKQSE